MTEDRNEINLLTLNYSCRTGTTSYIVRKGRPRNFEKIEKPKIEKYKVIPLTTATTFKPKSVTQNSP